MKKAVQILLFLCISGLAFGIITGDNEIIAAFKTGNAKIIASHFKANVDLSVLSKGNVSSKAQAEQILKNFFAKHPPKSFKIIHQGTSKLGTTYRIGTLTTSNGIFRVTINTKKEKGKEYIEQLRIDKD